MRSTADRVTNRTALDERPLNRLSWRHAPAGALLGAFLAFWCTAFPAYGQEAPDAGRTLQELQPPPAPPPAAPEIAIERPTADRVPPGGAQVTLAALEIEGNTVFSEAQLLEALGDITDKDYDLAGLYALAERVTAFYRRAGYPFALAYLPAQRATDGRVRIRVVEGRYGEVRAASEDADVAAQAQPYLAPLVPGAVIENRPLERAALLLEDLPGVTVSPTVRPGAETGTGDLIVQVVREPAVAGGVRLDNHGNRFSGEYRLAGHVAVSSPFRFGDRIVADVLASDEALVLGSVDYSTPLGASGLRAHAGYAQTRYDLGEDFAVLGASGRAEIGTIGVTYPLRRSQRVNVAIGIDYQHKDLRDEFEATGTRDDKRSRTVPISLRFDVSDRFGGGGITYGSAAWTHGRLELEEPLLSLDRNTLGTHGAFEKYNLDVVRLQRLPEPFSLYVRLSWQAASDNLDSSESFGLGGAQGVRAYPSGEAFGDQGWLGQVELRYALGDFSPYVFYDHGRINVNAVTGPNAEDRAERRAGAGFGTRWQQHGWRADAAVAWRTTGGEPESDTHDRRPRIWFSVGRDF